MAWDLSIRSAEPQWYGLNLIVVGCIWFLQGINILPGSFMTGQIRWAVYGGIAVVVGLGCCSRGRDGH